MKTLLGILLFTISLYACTGDCLTCHPALLPTINEDERHKPMLGCINCHSAKPNSMADCGNDCFACHTIEKINKSGILQHNVIQGCRDCHMQMKEKMFNFSSPPGQSYRPPLKEFLLQ